MKPGAGRAARYVSGKMPVSAKNQSRKEQTAKAASHKSTSNAMAKMAEAQTEEEKMAAMFQAQNEQWSAQQEEMAQYVLRR
jgi:protein MPE1